jgi:hypothetical protein
MDMTLFREFFAVRFGQEGGMYSQGFIEVSRKPRSGFLGLPAQSCDHYEYQSKSI